MHDVTCHMPVPGATPIYKPYESGRDLRPLETFHTPAYIWPAMILCDFAVPTSTEVIHGGFPRTVVQPQTEAAGDDDGEIVWGKVDTDGLERETIARTPGSSQRTDKDDVKSPGLAKGRGDQGRARTRPHRDCDQSFGEGHL